MRNHSTILLVENDPVDIMTVERAFKRNGTQARLEVTRNGAEALSFLHRDPPYTDAPKPDLILLDLNMPVMGGLEFLREIKKDEQLRLIPIVVLTTSREESDRRESFRLGVAGYIEKPLEFERFVEAMRTLDSYWTLSELP